MQLKRAWKSSPPPPRAEDRDRQRPQLRVGAVGEPVRRDRPLDIDMGGHRQRMDAGIGPPGGMERHLLVGDRRDRLLDRLLHRWAVRLALPAHERPAVKLHDEAEAGHAELVAPAGMAKPRSSSSGRIAARPARCTRVGTIAPSAQAMARPWSSTVPGSPAQLRDLRGEHADPLALMFEEGARRRVEGPDLALDLPRRCGRNRAAPRPCRSWARR